MFEPPLKAFCMANLGWCECRCLEPTSKPHCHSLSRPLKCAALGYVWSLHIFRAGILCVQSRYKPIKMRPSLNLSDSDIKFIMLHIKAGHKLRAEIIKSNERDAKVLPKKNEKEFMNCDVFGLPSVRTSGQRSPDYQFLCASLTKMNKDIFAMQMPAASATAAKQSQAVWTMKQKRGSLFGKIFKFYAAKLICLRAASSTHRPS